MTNVQMLQILKEASRQKKMDYIVHAVKAKIARKALKESLFRGNSLNEDLTPTTSGISVGAGSRTKAPSDIKTSDVKVSSAGFAKFPDPNDIEDEILMSVDSEKKYSGSDAAVVFFTGKGPGTYRKLLSDLKSAQDAAKSSKASAMSADELISAMQKMDSFSPEEQAKVKRNARAYILGFAKDKARLERGSKK